MPRSLRLPSLHGRLADIVRHVDAFFVGEALLDRPETVAKTRMGLLGCFTIGGAMLLYMPVPGALYSSATLAVLIALSLGILAFPFLARRTLAARYSGHAVCTLVMIDLALTMWESGGRTPGAFPVLTLIPILALLTQGRQASHGWALVALLTLAVGYARLASGAPAPAFDQPSPSQPYIITALCLTIATITIGGHSIISGRSTQELTRRARQALEARDERDRALLEYAFEGLFILDRDTRILFASPAGTSLLRLVGSQAHGRLMRDLLHPGDVDRFAAIWKRVLAGQGTAGPQRLRFRLDSGALRMLELHLSNQLDTPSVAGIVAHVRDVTELTHTAANYETLVEGSLQGIAVECDGRVVYANQALADLLGVRREQLTGRLSRLGLRYVHREDRSRIVEAMQSSPAGPTASQAFRFRRGDGRWRWIQNRWSDIVWEGRPARQLVYADVTAEKELAESHEREQERLETRIRERTRELERSQQQLREQERLAAIGTLAAGVAHQINNPVGAILSAADFALLTRDEGGSDSNRLEALEEIRSQAIRCGKIVRSILQFARAERAEKWSNDLSRVLRTALEVTARFAEERHALVDLEIAPEVAERSVSINPIEMEQVFVNLLRNGIESKPEGARVRISARIVDDRVETCVDDDGPGVSAAERNHVFEPFFTTRLREGGTGLGLSVAHGIVEDHGGRMWLDADAPVGACFHVSLPLEKPPVEAIH